MLAVLHRHLRGHLSGRVRAVVMFLWDVALVEPSDVDTPVVSNDKRVHAVNALR